MREGVYNAVGVCQETDLPDSLGPRKEDAGTVADGGALRVLRTVVQCRRDDDGAFGKKILLPADARPPKTVLERSCRKEDHSPRILPTASPG